MSQSLTQETLAHSSGLNPQENSTTPTILKEASKPAEEILKDPSQIVSEQIKDQSKTASIEKKEEYDEEEKVQSRSDEQGNPGHQLNTANEQEKTKKKSLGFETVGKFVTNIFAKTPAQLQQQQLEKEEKEILKQNKINMVKELQNERDVLLASAQSRKATVFEKLKNWDLERVAALNVQKSVLEGILGRVDWRTKLSQENIQGLNQLFQNIVNQIKKGIEASCCSLSASDKIYKGVYANLYDVAFGYEEENKKRMDIANEFGQKITNELYHTTFTDAFKKYEVDMSLVRQDLIDIRKQLNDQQNKIIKKWTRVKTVFQTNISIKKPQKDFLRSVYSLLRACQIFRDTSDVFAKCILKFWLKMQQLEVERAPIIQKAISLFTSLHEEYITKNNIPSPFTSKLVEQLQAQNFSQEYIAEQLDFNSLLPTEDKIYIAKLLGKSKEIIQENQEPIQSQKEDKEPQTIPEQKPPNEEQQNQESQEEIQHSNLQPSRLAKLNITIEDAMSVLGQPNYQRFDDLGLALKKIKVHREFPKNNFKPSTLIITPDCFLLCYDDWEQEQNNQEGNQAPQNISNQESLLRIIMRKPDFQMSVLSIQLSAQRNEKSLSIKSGSKQPLMNLLKPQNTCDLVFSCVDRLDECYQLLYVLKESSS